MYWGVGLLVTRCWISRRLTKGAMLGCCISNATEGVVSCTAHGYANGDVVFISSGWGRLNHLDSVSDSPAQREALGKMLPEVTDFYSSLALNERLWAVIKAAGESPEITTLSPIQKRFVEETLADFRNSGADLPAAQKERIAAIEAELSKITKEYSEHVLDSTNAWELVITDEAKLAGLPDSAKAGAAANARAKGHENAWRFTLQFPSMFPIMQHLHDDGIRRQVWEASSKVGSVGEFDNTALVWQILTLRHEKAAILGHEHFADLTLLRRMAKDGGTALGPWLVDRDDIADHYLVFGQVAGLAAARAVSRLDDDGLARLVALHEGMSQADNLQEQQRLNHEFHRTINKAAGSQRMSAMLQLLSRSLPMPYADFPPEWLDEANRQHRDILDAFKRRDTLAAQRAMEQHINASARHAIEVLEHLDFFEDE